LIYEVNPVVAASQVSDSLEDLLAHLHESHDVAVYAAIERLVRAGEAIGLDAKSLLRMLDRGMSFEALLTLIESRMEGPPKAA
jgi:hypothetical protein